MADHFVSSVDGNNGDTGHTMDLAWATIEYALESGSLVAGDIVWVKRTHSETPGSDIACAYDGTAGSPIQVIGWPRAALPNTTITGADWTNGSELVDNVAGITPDREKHIARRCTAPDGKLYLITAVLWEFTIDGMAGGAEFAVGEILTNTTQTKKGKVWAFTDNLDTTGTIQAVVDSSSAWIDDDNITSDGGGDAELSANATAVGFLIDREYPGSTVTGVNGKFQIEADDDYALAQAINDSGWTIDKADYTDDADDLPLIDFNDENFQLYISAALYHVFKNIEYKDSLDVNGIINIATGADTSIIGCLVKQTVQNVSLLGHGPGTNLFLERVILEGSGAGTSQDGIRRTQVGFVHFKDCAFHNLGGYGFGLGSSGLSGILQNTNLGIEMSNGLSEIYLRYGASCNGVDVQLGGTNGYVTLSSPTSEPKVSIGNFQKVLGDHVTYFPGGAVGSTGGFKNVDVGDANAPSAASPTGSTTDLICIYPNVANHEFIEDWAVKIATWKIWAAAAAETYTVYIQNNMGVTLNSGDTKADIWLKLRFVDAYDDATEYNWADPLFSTETGIAQRADQTDWDSLTIANHTPAVAGWAILELYVSTYEAAGQIYVDPLWV